MTHAQEVSAGAIEVVRLLGAADETLACAESLTAGLLSATVASVPGASAVLRGGIVAYATELKESVLGVPRAVLAEHGAVSEECARAMAVGVVAVCRASHGLALTGVAGPAPQEGHQPGHVCIGLAAPAGVWARTVHLPGDRPAVRIGAAEAALAWLAAYLRGEEA